jgi:hypothetical protein
VTRPSAFPVSTATEIRRCTCGQIVIGPGAVCGACLAKHPAMPASMTLATIASAIREAERAFELEIRAVNHRAAELAQLRKLYDATLATAQAEGAPANDSH